MTIPGKFSAVRVALVAVLLACFVLQGVVFLLSNSQTYDEAVHLAAGFVYLVQRDFRINDEHPPLMKELAALPLLAGYGPSLGAKARRDPTADQWRIGRRFLYESGVSADRLLGLGRLPILVLGTLLVGLAGLWSYRLWGLGGAFLALSLAAFDPTLVAHSSLATMDLGASLFIFLALYLCWEYAERPRLWLLPAVGAAVGLALASKFSGVFLVFCLPAVVGTDTLLRRRFGDPEVLPPADSPSRRRVKLLWACAAFAVIAVIVLLLLWASYLFTDISRWWTGFRAQVDRQQVGHPGYFLGRYSMRGWLFYFPVAFVFKTPAATLLLIALSLALWRFGTPMRRREALFLLLPVVLYFAAASRATTNVGVRYILPVYPFLFVVAGRVATLRSRPAWIARAGVGAAAALTALSSLSSAPHQLAFFNRLVVGPSNMGYRYLSASNVDWGQDLRNLKEYLERHGIENVYLSYSGSAPPDYYKIAQVPLPCVAAIIRDCDDWSRHPGVCDTLAVSVINLHGTYERGGSQFRWLEDRSPSAHIGGSILVYDLSGDLRAHLHLAKLFADYGIYHFAETELRYVLRQEPENEAAKLLLSQVEELKRRDPGTPRGPTPGGSTGRL